MQIWIDADACPREVKEVVFRASERLAVPVVLVANKAMIVPKSSRISFVQVRGGPDVADDYIAEHAVAEDLGITADIPLAARLVRVGVTAIDPRGHVYDARTIGDRLAVRDLMSDLRDQGAVTGGPAAFSPKDKQRFASTLDRLLSAWQRRQQA